MMPGALKVRLLPADISEPDQTALPRMGFGDLDMVQSTLTEKQKPVVQGEGEDRHLAVTSAVTQNNQVVGVILVSLKPDLINQSLTKLKFSNGYIEVIQDQIALGTKGDQGAKSGDPDVITIEGSRWLMRVWTASTADFSNLSLIIALLVFPALFALGAFYLGYKKLADYLMKDQAIIIKAAKDMLTGKITGNYPMQLDEMQPIISTLTQFKRVINQENTRIKSFDENPEAEFFDESFNIDYIEESFDTEIDDAPRYAPVSMPVFDAVSNFPPADDFMRDENEAVAFTDHYVMDAPSLQSGISIDKKQNSGISPVADLPLDEEISYAFEDSYLNDERTIEFDQVIAPDESFMDEEVAHTFSDNYVSDTPKPPPAFSSEKYHVPSVALDKSPTVAIEKSADIFRCYDIRGIVGKDLNETIAANIGRAVASQAYELGIKTMVVGRDGRLSSPSLAAAVIKGICETGCNVIDIGLSPTPVLYFVAHHIDGHSGIMITGSHNPAEYNGLKMVLNGETLAEDKIQAIKKRIAAENYHYGEPGTVTENDEFTDEYIGNICEDLEIFRPMKVVMDCGNGVAGDLGPLLLRTMGCEVIELYCSIDGNFPHHHPDPSIPENMADLISAVKKHAADIGIAFDGDGDRLGVVDAKGKIIWPDRQMMLFARDLLARKMGADIIYDVKCSKHLQDLIIKRGGHPIIWKSGHSLMKAKIKETGAALAGEMSGHIYFNDRWYGFDDALYAAARLLQILSEDMRSSDEVFADFPESISTPELKVAMPEAECVDFIAQMLTLADFNDANIIDIDGMRVELADAWGLVRASNTTPCLTLRFEADNEAAMARIQTQFKFLMRQIKPNISLPF
jgi:phosphomannomutase/phosphoglucomutase